MKHKLRRPDSNRISYDDFMQIFDMVDGVLVRKIYKRKVGSIKSTGYHRIKIDRVEYFTHHLVWFWHHKRWPTEIDHIDRNKLNNRIENLRECTRSENQRNLCKPVICSNGDIYDSVVSASKYTGVRPSNIGAAASGKRKTAGGLTWRFANNQSKQLTA